uniref:Glutathione synthetase n=1 Tax=Globodera rostochiensis TaxID=31243 RepID=A0A914H4U1_GLORO
MINFNSLVIFIFLFEINSGTEPKNPETTGKVEASTEKPFDFDEENVQTLVEDAIDWAHNIFLVMRTPEHKDRSDVVQNVPFTLFPSPFPREMFKEAVDVAKAMSLLYFRVSRDFEFLKMVYKDLLESDVSIRNYMKICEEVHNEGIKQPVSIYLQRSDYLVHVKEDGAEKKFELKQIEVNGGSIGGANGIPPRITEIHARMLEKAGMPNLPEDVLPRSKQARSASASMLVTAWNKFNNPNAIIVSLVLKDKSKWHFCKRFDEYEIDRMTNKRVKIVYLSISEAIKMLRLDEDFTLRLEGKPVAVFYINIILIGVILSQKTLEMLKMAERSTAIKSPSLFYELSISKKVQQVLTLPGMVERFFPDPKEAPMVQGIRKTFAKLWGLENDDSETREIIADAIAHPERYVMKPNQEGGGKNFWEKELADKLRTLTLKERAAFILMERLNPLVVKNYLIWPMEKAIYSDVVTEVGVYTYCVYNTKDGTLLRYTQPGQMSRTKLASSNEGGISAGTGVFDSLYLY